jgi:hypothetical protein
MIDKEQSCRCLMFGDIEGKTDSTVVVPEDQVLSKNCVKEKF